MMLNRSNDVELDFDFDKVKEKKRKSCFTFICIRKNKFYVKIIKYKSNDELNLVSKLLPND